MLTVNYNSIDLSIKLEEFSLPVVPITLLSTEFIYIGYYKPITNFHIEFNNSVTSLSNLAVEYETASGIASVKNLIDRTNGLGNSGKVSWDITEDAIKSTKFGKELYWIQLSVNVNTVEMGYAGISVLFSSDKDITEEYPGIMDNLPAGETSFISFHSSAKKDIVQSLRKKYKASDKLLTAFDLLENEQVRQTAKYLALSKIFNWLSDAPADKWSEKAKAFHNDYLLYFNDIELTIDTNDNGQIDEEEKNTISYVRLVRV